MKENDRKGSVTIEACLVLPFFLCFFILLAFTIKAAGISIVLNHAANETAKQLASCCYPLSYINKLEDEKISKYTGSKIPTVQEELDNAKEYAANGLKDTLIKTISGESFGSGLKSSLNTTVMSIIEDIGRGAAGTLIDGYSESYFKVKSQTGRSIIKTIVEGYCGNSLINKDRIRYLLAELPKSQAELNNRKNDHDYVKVCSELGFHPEKDDVVVVLEYDVRLSLPFFGSRSIAIGSTAVERAWMQGHLTTNATGGIQADKTGDIETSTSGSKEVTAGSPDEKEVVVYITKTGTKYHFDGCDYLSKSQIPILLEEAIRRGYEPCKVCVTKTAEPFPGRTGKHN